MDDPPAGCLETPVSFAVALEGDAGAVSVTTVQLGDDPLLRPEAVGLHFPVAEVEESVELWPGQVRAGEQGREAKLELAAHTTARTGTKALQTGSDGCGAAPTGVPIELRFELWEPEAMKVFRLAYDRFHAFDGECG